MVDWDQVARTAETPWDAGLWSEESMRGRMDRAATRLQLSASSSILDWGCGIGYFVNYVPKGCSYLGVDRSRDMIHRAQIENPTRSFCHTEAFPRDVEIFSHVLALGVWNLSDDWTKDETWRQVHWLWRLVCPSRMTISLFSGMDHFSRHLVYSASTVAAQAEQLAPNRWLLERWRDNDLMLTLYR